MGKRFSEVGVDPFWPQVSYGPRQTPDKDLHLLQVSGGATDPLDVGSGQFNERHGEYSQLGTTWYTQRGQFASSPKNRYILPNGQLAQLVSCPLWEALRITLWVSAQILRAGILTFLAVAFLADRMELVLGLLAAGQFAQAFTEVVRPRRG